MDLLFQPQTVGKGKRISTPFTFRTYSMPVTGEYQYSGLCYIGRNTSFIARLIRIYNKAYAADKLEHARNELLRRVDSSSDEIPEIIICEGGFGLDAIRKFINFLRQHPVLNSIPFCPGGEQPPGEGTILI